MGDPLILGDRRRQHLGEVVASERHVAGGGAHLHHALVEFEQRDVEGAAAEIEHEDGALLLRRDPVGERRRGRLVDEALHRQAGEAGGVEGGLALDVVEIGRHRDHRLGHFRPEMRLRVGLEALQHQRRQLLRAEALAAAEPGDVARPHPALEGGDRALGLGGEPLPRGAPDQHRPVRVEADNGGRQRLAERVGDEPRSLRRPDGDRRVRGAEIDADDRHEAPFGSGGAGPPTAAPPRL
ncbi:hypothetical protein CHKEEEPN_4566 [Methylorubrum podarium]|nr:hypothetical protein CHKEEEPN_4566 [Methylorubrum podarium]